ncbi:MAG: alpha-D-ribose 1-methylphosphonate 5-phosphate C-P-lyase PhnJ [Holdemania massiliensis]
MPAASTGGLQLTLSCILPEDLKVIDQGSDESVNAISIKNLITSTTGVQITQDTEQATLIQSRHRIPEVPLSAGQILVLQVPTPEPLRSVEPSERLTKKLHAEAEYSGAWLMLFEQIMKYGRMATGADHPVRTAGRYVMAPSPIPKFDNPKMDHSEALILLGAGREKKIYAVPPYTSVVSLDFEDVPFEAESFEGKKCSLCGAEHVYLDEILDADGTVRYQCNDALPSEPPQPQGGKLMEVMETPLMSVRHLYKQFGTGCIHCQVVNRRVSRQLLSALRYGLCRAI